MPAPEAPSADWLWANEPCRAACPVNTDAGAYVTAIAEGRFEDAYLIARAPNPFPSVCGSILSVATPGKIWRQSSPAFILRTILSSSGSLA